MLLIPDQDRTSCLNRESSLVQSHNGLRRNRKALLADLSSLAKIAKTLQEDASGSSVSHILELELDELVLKAFKMVMRAVKFLDIWYEDICLAQDIDSPISALDMRAITDQFPSTPPAEKVSFDPIEIDRPQTVSQLLSGQVLTADGGELKDRNTQNGGRPPHSRSSRTYIRAGTSQSNGRPLSMLVKRPSISHRVSNAVFSTIPPNPNLASEKLSASHDSFLGFLGCFIGLHLQSRSSREVLVTTQQSVNACKDMLAVVEEVWERDLRRSLPLEEARDNMYTNIAILVQAVREIFRPDRLSEEEEVFMPNDGKRLVTAATACVRGAGECVAKTRYVTERIGDFEFEPLGLGILPTEGRQITTSGVDPAMGDLSTTNAGSRTISRESSKPLPLPPLQIPNQHSKISEWSPTMTSDVVSSDAIASDVSPKYTFHTSMSSILPPLPDLASPLMPPEEDSPVSENGNYTNQSDRIASVDVSSMGASSTMVDSMRHSNDSAVSQSSTRATSPDDGPNRRFDISFTNSFSGSRTTLNEECDEGEIKVLEKTFAHELVYNKDGQVTGGTLPALIERLTTYDTTPDAMFVSAFYLTFRLFATPLQFAEALIERFEYIAESPQVSGPVRLRVYNVFKGWLESHWRSDYDKSALKLIVPFATDQLYPVLPSAGKRMIELADKVSDANGTLVPRLISSMGKTNTSVAQYVAPDTPLPAPVITKGQLTALKNWKHGGSNPSILDFDPLELARQITIKESGIFCSILPEELLATEWMKKSGSVAVNVRAMSTLSTDLANLVADCILQLEDPKKRATIIKQWVKIANKCLELNNYDSLMAIICALNSSTIVRMKRTWELVSAKTKATLDNLKGIVEVSRNYHVLRQRLQNHVPPCLPFVGTYLTDLTFIDVGNQTTRQLPGDDGEDSISVINFDKHMKTAKIISELQRFQIPYRLTEVPELQTWMQDQLVRVRSSDQSNMQTYYRRSLLLEPREKLVVKPSPADSQASAMSSKENHKLLPGFPWAYSSKDKSAITPLG